MIHAERRIFAPNEKCVDDNGNNWACNLNHDGQCYPQANPIPMPVQP
jgi:hypothetical protein